MSSLLTVHFQERGMILQFKAMILKKHLFKLENLSQVSFNSDKSSFLLEQNDHQEICGYHIKNVSL